MTPLFPFLCHRLLHDPDLALADRPHPDHRAVHQLRGQPDPAQLPGVRHLAAPQQARLHHHGASGHPLKPDAGALYVISLIILLMVKMGHGPRETSSLPMPGNSIFLNIARSNHLVSQGTSDDPRAPLAGNLRPTQPTNGRLVRQGGYFAEKTEEW